MAMDVVGGALLSSFLSVLFDRLASRPVVDFIRGQKITSGLLRKLRIKLLSVNSVLNDAEEKQFNNPAVREWLDELKDALYAADDLLDEIKTEALRRKLEGDESESSSSKSQVGISSSTWIDEFDKTMEPKIVEMLGRLEFIVNEKDVLGLNEGVPNRRPQSRLSATSLVEEDGVYGRDEDKEAIVKLLLSDDANGNKLSVIPVVGMGGIGKTTLSQLVYNDARVKQHFDLQAWVYVSEEFDVVRITQIIYGSVISQTCSITDLNLLQVKLKEALTGKKCFFVHDDVWNENYIHWDALRCSFESVAHGSKIIVTTRNQRVASMMGTVTAYHLNQISEKDCGLLFSKHAFGRINSAVHPTLEEISSGIIKKCKGLPLAAKSLGGLLRCKQSYEEWDEILKSEIWDLQDEYTILPALRLSYHHLPSHLKRCFSYCSIFPKGYKFGKSELVLLWMAEGFLSPQRKKMMEDVGVMYFDDLISRSFFQHSGDDQSLFTMHDLINDLAKFVSREFCFRLDDSDSFNNVSSKTRHFSYTQNSPFLEGLGVGVHATAKEEISGFDKFEALCEAKYLRTFLAIKPGPLWNIFCFNKVPHDLLRTLYCLRVLSLSHCNNKELPYWIGNLKHLRYIDLSYSRFEKLPETICTLYNLQTLLLFNCDELAQLPINLGRLINLRHLDVRSTNLKEMPPHMDKLKDLHTLSDFVVGKQAAPSIVVLKELQLVGTLAISGLHNIVTSEDAFVANMRNKHLDGLALIWGAETDDSQKDREVLNNLQPHTTPESPES
ncbi:putative disease resistance RPP13-like protein 1 [Pyrus x bretschneideri]|uniref:putative disease resistance RPP13-like protein 1 n=1 Tax=Pyrus x bretschneideri TaxID=225117 RepID=UPI00202F0A3F|nr:putative disease resistance RPP13-like protein 1 [Pyrus x bretschneideri]